MPVKVRDIAIVGCCRVGKTSLMLQFIRKKFDEFYVPTFENRLSKILKIGEQEYRINIVDTQGLYEFSYFQVEYSYVMHGFCMVYSITDKKSFEVIRVIYEKLMHLTGNIRLPMILVANKLDMEFERKVGTIEGQRFADFIGAEFLEVSAKHNISINDLFMSLITSIENSLYDGRQPTSSEFTERSKPISLSEESVVQSYYPFRCFIA